MSSSRASNAIALLPFGYYWATRLTSLRDVAYLVVTSWVPILWVGWASGTMDTGSLLTAFAAGYLTFISAYELGYLANDAWDAGRHSDGRARGSDNRGWAWIVTFVAVRVSCWSAIAVMTGWWQQPEWLAGYACLGVVFALHNLLKSTGLRLATFAQLAIFRIMLPLFAVLPQKALGSLFVVAVLAYLPLRYLSYAESKGLLSLAERRAPWFGATYLALTLPLLLLASWLLGDASVAAISLFLAAAHVTWSMAAHQLSSAKR